MTENQDLLVALQSLLGLKKSKEYYAKRLNITVEEINELFKKLNIKTKAPKNNCCREQSIKVNNEKGTIESVLTLDYLPKSEEELAKLHKIDLGKYKINYWSKLLPNGKFTSSVQAVRKKEEDLTGEDFLKILEKFQTNYIPIPIVPLDTTRETIDVELSLSDYHLAKKHINGDNGVINRVQTYLNTAESLIRKVRGCYNIDTVVFPISNDFFHTDNYQNQTTNGTPQDVIMDYAEEYEIGFKILVDTITMLLANSKEVKVILVQGNHDRTKSYYLAHSLAVYFRAENRVSFDREHNVVKGITLGNTFIGFHHGNCKIDDLPLLFATHPIFSMSFGNSKYREVHTGDKHHYMAKDIKGVRVQQMPSLSGIDRWHADNNYVHSVRAALALVYNRDVGKIAEFEERI